MSEQQPVGENVTTTVRIGFEAALEQLNPNWKTEFSPEQIGVFRYFYQAAMRNLGIFVNSVNASVNQLNEGFQFMHNNAIGTGNPELAAQIEGDAEVKTADPDPQAAQKERAAKPTKPKAAPQPKAKPAGKKKR